MKKNGLNTGILSLLKDPMGVALTDYYQTGRASKLLVHSPQFETDEIPVKHLFRAYSEMSRIEQQALRLSKGRILDVGAGSGCHSLALQEMGKQVCAIDISVMSVNVMANRGVKDARAVNLFDEQFREQFDTILMLMNGSGIIGRLENMSAFFERMRQLLTPNGCILMDSSDLRYLYEDEEGDSFVVDLAGDYYGEVKFRMRYQNIRGDSFPWLYIDYQTLQYYAALNGFKVSIVEIGDHYDYLACLQPAREEDDVLS